MKFAIYKNKYECNILPTKINVEVIHIKIMINVVMDKLRIVSPT